jgi:His/Glu/Gln/Arg/opine family amino acid ABC transporter permease subunit
MFDLTFYATWAPFILLGLKYTLTLSLAAALIGIGLGLVLALIRLADVPVLSRAVSLFVEYVRGVPALVVLFFTYYALPQVGIKFDAFWAAAIGLGVNESVFAAEIFRAGIQSLPRGQLEAGRGIGLSTADLYRFVVLPQAIAWIIPPLTNDLIGLIKNSSLASTITVEELSLRATAVVSATFRPFEVYAVLATVYVGLALATSTLSHRLERRMRFTT